MALSIASFEPEPTEKCAVAAAVAQQHDVLVDPALAQHAVEIEPGRAAQMLAHWSSAYCRPGCAAKIFSQARNGFFGRHVVEAGAPPGVFRAFDNERRGVGIELIGVRPDPAVLGFLEDEGEGVVEFLVGAEPDVFAGAHVDIRLEHIGVSGANAGIDAVGADDQVVVVISVEILCASVSNRRSTPSASARSCKMFKQPPCGRCRQKPWPPERITALR